MDNKKTRYLKGDKEAWLIEKKDTYEATFTNDEGMNFFSDFPFEDYGSKSKALAAAKMELSSYGYYKARIQDQIKKEPRLLSRIEIDHNLLVLLEVTTFLKDYGIYPEDIKELLEELTLKVEKLVSALPSIDANVQLKIFEEIYED